VIGIEDLNVRGMMANGKLSRAVADVGMFEFRRQLEYKAAMQASGSSWRAVVSVQQDVLRLRTHPCRSDARGSRVDLRCLRRGS
jgi:hypothetical protein